MIRLLVLLLLAAPAFAGEVIVPPPTFVAGKWPPVAVTDPVPGATHCALVVDNVRKAWVPVAANGGCRNDVSGVSVGARRIQLVAARIDSSGVTEYPIVPPYAQSCALVAKPSTTSFRVGWHGVVTCTQLSGCKTHCP